MRGIVIVPCDDHYQPTIATWARDSLIKHGRGAYSREGAYVRDSVVDYIPKSALANYPKPLQSLYESKFAQLGYNVDLLAACGNVSLELIAEMVSAVERSTRDQSNSNLWFKYRAGRTTASRMKAACKTDPA